MANLDLKETLDLLDYLVTRVPPGNKEIQGYLGQRDKGATGDPLDLKEILESLVHQDQRVHLVRPETQELQESKDLLETLAKEDQGVQLVNLAALDHKDYLACKGRLVLWVPPVLLAPLVTQYQLLQQQCQEEKLFLGLPDHRDLWDLQDLQGSEELLELGDLREEEEHLDHLALLVDQGDKDYLEDLETLELQAKMDARGEPTVKMICGKFVRLFSEIVCLNLLLALLDPQVLLEGEGLVDLENLAQGVLLVTLVFKERQGQEGFLGFLAYLALLDHLVSRVTGEYRGILDLLGWEWKDQLDQQDLMDHPVLLGLENLERRVLEDHLGNTVAVVCLAGPAQLAPLATASFVRHLRCKPTEEDKRKDNNKMFDSSYSILGLDHACRKLSTTAKVVTNMNSRRMVGSIIFVTNIILVFISHHFCVPQSSASCALVPYIDIIL